MNRLMIIAALSVGVLSCAGTSSDGTQYYDNNDLELAAANGAFMTCSCIFVMEMPEDFCKAWVKASPSVARFSIDRTHKTVESSAFISWAARAHWVDDKRGCVLE